MKSQLNSFICWLLTVVHSLLSNPQRVRQIVFVLAACLAVAAVFVPSLISLAAGIGGGGH